jgi:hypothetical protein
MRTIYRLRVAHKLARLTTLSRWASVARYWRPYIDLLAGGLMLLCVGGLVPDRVGDATLVTWTLVLALDLGLGTWCTWHEHQIKQLLKEVQ